ncbi:MAG TPA: SUMF1/EgtB/PvdO family nonheme iron enzyme [Candidatus Limnocylindria bacterium]|nr:SUMF1/EgtB/PvdO family nonheme iron enzyme [Candidatus Limnocylindria bacterium]
MPRERGADLGVLDDAKIIAAPDDPADWPAWREQLTRWRDDARGRIRYSGALYERPEFAWTQRCFSVCLAWLWDDLLYDRSRGEFTPDRFLDAGDRDFGGFDGVVLWHAYPVIGIDQRNQFDFYRDVPELASLIDRIHQRGVRVFLDYNPWDRGTRREPIDDVAALAALVREFDVDGIFLDTLREGAPELRGALDRARPGVALEGESNLPLARITDHHLSWAQWFADGETPGVLRARWLEQRHQLHHIRRWSRDHREELQSAWLNGCGMVVWENVFGSWVGWNASDRATLRAIVPVQRCFLRHFTEGRWTPLADAPAAEPGSRTTFASRFELDGQTIWTVVSRAAAPYHGVVLETQDRPGGRWFEITTGRELRPEVRDGTARIALDLPARGLAGVVATGRVDGELARLLDRQRSHAWTDDTTFPERPVVRSPAPRAPSANTPPMMFDVAGGPRELRIQYRLRETGLYENAAFADSWKPSPQHLHRQVVEELTITLTPFAIATREVSNAEFAEFVAATGYSPGRPERFLAHWRDKRPVRGSELEAVTHVDLDDARAYAAWAELRLPTEHEWQVAASDARFQRSQPLVWNWTESEHSDGRTRFSILKGGSAFLAEGSVWYTDGGPQPPEVSLKLLRAGPSIERSSTIGFRCAVDRDGR